MAAKTRLVNLDAMIPRADFALADEIGLTSHEKPQQLRITDLKSDGFMRPILRKPDFQRETNHWSPEQVVTLLQCYLNGDLIPSIILWKSPTFLFVIDGGHRLSAIRAWIEDDYGDGEISKAFFGDAISKDQRKSAVATRALIEGSIGTWRRMETALKNSNPAEQELRRINTIASRAMHVQWVEGNAEKAEASFFKINTQGTALDEIEERLLSNRRKPVAIASRAIIRAGMGHRYWSKFNSPVCDEIESIARQIHETLFQPEFDTPIKTLDLPLGGSTGVRAALQILIDFALAAARNQVGDPKEIKDQPDDETGEATKECLKLSLRLASRLSGNDNGSLGLHPAIYFYGPTGRHSTPMFLGMSTLVSLKLINNNSDFFHQFTNVRARLERILIEQKDLIANVLQKTISRYRLIVYSIVIDEIVSTLNASPEKEVSDIDIIKFAGVSGKIITGGPAKTGEKFSDETKSAVFIKAALKSAIKCHICQGYLDPPKSLSYDHKVERAKGGLGSEENCQLTHPYCNQAFKNKASQSQNG